MPGGSDAQAGDAETGTDVPQERDNTASGSNILIAYFTAAENSGVDAVAAVLS